jgi:parallel beta-helix repeat protein
LFRGNQIHSNQKFGIQLQGRSDDNTLTKNNISGSQTGIFVESDGNSIYGNRLADNVVQAEDRGQNRWNEAYPVGGNSWADFAGEDAMSGPYQNVTGSDGIGDVPYEIQGGARDLYPVMGERFVPIRIEQTSITPAQAVIGDDVVIQAKIMSKFGLSGVSVRARSTESEATGYVRMIPSGDTYQGTLATALFEPGRYELVLSAADRRGYELEDIIGQVELVSRQGRDFQAAMAEMGRR